MTKYLLDTNIRIGLARGEAGLQNRLQGFRVSQVHCCSVERGNWSSAPFDDGAAARYGVIRRSWRLRGLRLARVILMIAALALARDWVVVSRNAREFVRVPGLRVEVW